MQFIILFVSGKKVFCQVDLNKVQYFIPYSKVRTNDSEKICQKHGGTTAVFNPEVFHKENSSCLFKTDLLVKQNLSDFIKTKLVTFDVEKINLEDINKDIERKVLCTRPSTINSNKSETSTSSISGINGLYLAIGTTLTLFVGIPSILFGISPIKVISTFI